MAVTINGTTGIAGVDGSASTPAVQGTDTNTGIFFPAADTIAFGEGGSEAMRIDSSGNVGIGSTSPSTFDDANGGRNLVLQSTGTQRGVITFASQQTSGADNVLGIINFIDSDSTNTNYRGARVLGMLGSDANSAYLRFDTANSAAGTERARITSDGEVCINTTGIGSTKLRVYQNGNSNDNSYSGIDIIKGSNNTTTSQVFQRFFTDAGNVGNGSITANGVSGATFTAYSDRRLKENIQDLPPQLDNICRLKPSEFDYIGYPEGQGHQIGFIAQDMQEVYPDVVAADGEGMLQIGGWSKTEARLVKAIQELNAKVETLEAQNAAFEARLAALEAK